MCKRRRGFTLIELLSVVVIIAMLVAILLPAVNAAREAGRRTVCINNQHEVSLGLIQYEVNKQHFPGMIVPGGPTLNWCMSILHYIDRNDLWNNGWSTGSGTAAYVVKFVCPDDAPMVTGGTVAALDYVTNANVFSPSATPLSMSLIKTAKRTVMLGEHLQIFPTGPWTSTTQGTPSNPGPIMFGWPTPSPATGFIATSPTILSSSHPGILVMTFFDGHTEAVTDDTPVNTYFPGP